MIKTVAPALVASLRPALQKSFIAFIALFALASAGVRAASSDDLLREQDVKRGERIISKLREMESARLESTVAGNGRRLFEKISGSLFVWVAGLRASDLKTDLTTAVFLYQEATHLVHDANDTKLDCQDELRESYAKLCRENQPSTHADFLRAKAQLHLRWAEAVIRNYLGQRDDATLSLLEEMRRERSFDLKLAESGLLALRSLEKEIHAHSTLAEFEEQRTLSRVPFERLAADISVALSRVDRVLGSLSRSQLFYPLYHARNAYSDGLFWWQKTVGRNQLVVNINSFKEPEALTSSRLKADEVDYAVVINWRNAIRHTRAVADAIEALKQ